MAKKFTITEAAKKLGVSSGGKLESVTGIAKEG
jgi:hypothetical protein